MATALRFDLVSRRIGTLETEGAASVLVLSSTPYPIEAADSMTMGAALASGSLSLGLYVMAPENVTLDVSLIGGTLRNPLLTTSVAAENVTLSVSLGTGELRQMLLSTSSVAENVTLDAALSSGDLSVKLVNYTGWTAENATLSAALTSGSLV